MMNLDTREEKIEFIRMVVNSDEYFQLLSDSEIDDFIRISKSPIYNRIESIRDGIRSILENIIDSIKRR